MKRSVLISTIILISAILGGTAVILVTNPKYKTQFTFSGSDFRTGLANHYFRFSAQPKRMNFTGTLDYEVEEIPGFYLHYATKKLFSTSAYILNIKIHCIWASILVIPILTMVVFWRARNPSTTSERPSFNREVQHSDESE